MAVLTLRTLSELWGNQYKLPQNREHATVRRRTTRPFLQSSVSPHGSALRVTRATAPDRPSKPVQEGEWAMLKGKTSLPPNDLMSCDHAEKKASFPPWSHPPRGKQPNPEALDACLRGQNRVLSRFPCSLSEILRQGPRSLRGNKSSWK